MNNTIAVVAATAVALAGACTAVASDSGTGDRGSVHNASAPVPEDFLHPRQNQYFPLRPGVVFRYRGTDDGERLRETVTVTRRTRTIQGIRTTVVHDVLRRADGTVAERTSDWYAADKHGDVWYFGERTATYDHHDHVPSREGSWEAGVHGASAGLIMPHDPVPTDAYRQELQRGSAEDQAWIVQRGFRVHVLGEVAPDAVRSLEWSRLEPGVVSQKLYAPHLGMIREEDLAGGTEAFHLVSVTHR